VGSSSIAPNRRNTNCDFDKKLYGHRRLNYR
jgi:hypothetical protein